MLGRTGALYETGTELKEGLARLVESRARRTSPPEPVIRKEDFGPGDIRSRSYAVGHAYGVLLERFAKGWEASLEGSGEKTLDGLLAPAIPTEAARRPCRFRSRETAETLDRAKRSVELLRLTRVAIRDAWRHRLDRGVRFDRLTANGRSPPPAKIQPFARAIPYASIRFAAPTFQIASDR